MHISHYSHRCFIDYLQSSHPRQSQCRQILQFRWERKKARDAENFLLAAITIAKGCLLHFSSTLSLRILFSLCSLPKCLVVQYMEWDLQKTRKHLTRCLSRQKNFRVSIAIVGWFFFVVCFCQSIVSAVLGVRTAKANNKSKKKIAKKLVPNNSLSDPDGYGILCCLYWDRWFVWQVLYATVRSVTCFATYHRIKRRKMIKCLLPFANNYTRRISFSNRKTRCTKMAWDIPCHS